MAYQANIPLATNNVGDDLQAINENFSLLEDSQVVDEGSTNDGDYIRYENGWQICINHELTLTFNSNRYLSSTWSFPASFLEAPSISLNARGTSATVTPTEQELGIVKMRSDTNDTTSSLATLFRQAGQTDFVDGDEFIVDLFAIGRWK